MPLDQPIDSMQALPLERASASRASIAARLAPRPSRPAVSAYCFWISSSRPAYEFAAASSRVPVTGSRQRSARTISGCAKNAFSRQLPSNTVPGAAISAKIGVDCPPDSRPRRCRAAPASSRGRNRSPLRRGCSVETRSRYSLNDATSMGAESATATAFMKLVCGEPRAALFGFFARAAAAGGRLQAGRNPASRAVAPARRTACPCGARL